jgi:hypothetical protein
MSEQTNHNLQDTIEGKRALNTPAPYENVLNTAFSKLTSQILVFLLAYMVLLVVLVWIGPTLSIPFIGLFYIIPILAMISYIWVKRQGIVAKPQESRNVNVKVRKAEGEAFIGGERGIFPDTVGSTTVSTGHVRDQAQVIGRDRDNITNTNTRFLNSLFEKLDQRNQMKLISNAQEMLTKQEDSHS